MSVFVNDGGVEKEAKMIYVNDGGIDKLVAGGREFVPPIGGAFEGGFVAYIEVTETGVYAAIIADKSAEQSLQWRTELGNDPGALSETDGWANTIAVAGPPNYPAANYCRDYRGGGFDDWFLMASEQALTIYQNLGSNLTTSPPNFRAGGEQAFSSGYYWTSTQSAATGASANAAKTKSFVSSPTSSSNKTQSLLLRPMRMARI